jgi:transposase-like protein
MLRFPITELLDETDCYAYLLQLLHPDGLACPHGHELPTDQAPHKQESGAVVSYRCRSCHAVFNLFSGTLFSGTHYSCRTLVLFLRGVVQGLPTCLLADELHCDYGTLLAWRHRLQAQALLERSHAPLADDAVETDEMFQNAGEKGELHSARSDPPRRRANKREGRGTMHNDRAPVVGVVGRETGQIRLVVVEDTQQATVAPLLEEVTQPDATVYSDEADSFAQIGQAGRVHLTVNHGTKQWARDADGDGQREVHDNTMEGIWTGLRNFLQPFRGIHKRYLGQYVAIFEWAYNLKHVTEAFLRCLLLPRSPELPI